MSTHSIDVVQIEMKPHPNADKLALVEAGGYTVCVNKADWQDGQLAAYVPPDYVVPVTRPEFAWLKDPAKFDQTYHRVKVKKLRGIYSQGLLVPAPAGSKLGDDVIEQLGIYRYEDVEPADVKGIPAIKPPGFNVIPKYDVEGWNKNKSVFVHGEEVVVTEKIHGANARFLYTPHPPDSEEEGAGQLHCGSRSEWKMAAGDDMWWRFLKGNQQLWDLLVANPNKIFYGEIFGQVQDLTYGAPPGITYVRIFDVWDGERWLPWDEYAAIVPESWRPPLLYKGPYTDQLASLAEGKTLIPGANHIREGCVIRPVVERFDRRVGRVHLKVVGNGYLERA